MAPKKAIIIVSVLFLAAVIIWFFLYLNKFAGLPANNINNNLPASSANREKLSPEQKKNNKIEETTSQLVEQITKQGETASGGLTIDAQKQIEEAVNQEIREKIKLKTSNE